MKHQILFNFLCVTFQGFGFSDLHLIGSKGFFVELTREGMIFRPGRVAWDPRIYTPWN